jgi:hypothetical protein
MTNRKPHIIGSRVIHLPRWLHIDTWSLMSYGLGLLIAVCIFSQVFR